MAASDSITIEAALIKKVIEGVQDPGPALHSHPIVRPRAQSVTQVSIPFYTKKKPMEVKQGGSVTSFKILVDNSQ